MLEEEIFDFICTEFKGIQRKRALDVFYTDEMSTKELNKFYSNWFIKTKFELKNQLQKYYILKEKYRLINRTFKKNCFCKDNILIKANYIVEFKNIEIQMQDISRKITSTGYNIMGMIKKIESIGLFTVNDISTIFSIPINKVIEGTFKYKNDPYGVIFNLIIIDCAEATYFNGDLEEINIAFLPFYWSLNMSYFDIKERNY